MPPKQKKRPPCADAKLVKILQRAFRKAENNVGGDVGTQGINGSITVHYTNEIFKSLGLKKGDIVMDAGCGLCKPLLEAMRLFGITFCHGFEVDAEKATKARDFISRVCALEPKLKAFARRYKITVLDVGQIGAITPAPTVLYTFWEGFSPIDKMRLAKLFLTHITSLKGLACTQRAIPMDPEEYMWTLGFRHLQLKESFKVSMSGAGSQFQTYVFTVKIDEKKDKEMQAKYGPVFTYFRGLGGDRKTIKPSRHMTEICYAQRKENTNINNALATERDLAARVGPDASTTLSAAAADLLVQNKSGVLSSTAMDDARRQTTYRPVGPMVPDLYVNGNGGIFSLHQQKEVGVGSADSNTDGHAYVRIRLGGKWHYRPVRTLVALAWLPGATLESLGLDEKLKLTNRMREGCLEVVHCSDNKYDNSVPNLRLRNPQPPSQPPQLPQPQPPHPQPQPLPQPPQLPPPPPPPQPPQEPPPPPQEQQAEVDFGPLAALAKAAVFDALYLGEQYAAALVSTGKPAKLMRPGTTPPDDDEGAAAAEEKVAAKTAPKRATGKKRRSSGVPSAGAASPTASALPLQPEGSRRRRRKS